MKIRICNVKWGAICIVLSLCATGVRADIAAGKPTPAPKDAGIDQLAEVTVTAQKRVERLQDVPISVSVLAGDDFAKHGVKSTKDLEFLVPSLVTNELAGFSETFLRGVGTDIQNPGAEAGVANYIDGVYDPFTSSVLTSLLGIQRTEVLYGPQGTLFGRNAVGGAINYVTLTPTHDFDAAGTATVGNYARKELSGYISGGVSQNLALGLYAAGTIRNSFLTFTPSRPDLTPQHEMSSGVRLKGVYTPTDTLTVTGTLEFQRSLGAEAGAFRQLQDNAYGFAVFGAPKVIQFNVIQANAPASAEADQFRGVVQIEKNMSWADLVSVSSYQNAHVHGSTEVDATSAPFVAASNFSPKLHDVSEELRIQSPTGTPVQWVGGVYYSNDVAGFLPDTTFLQADALPPGSPDLQNDTYTRQNSISTAIFGQATLPLVDRFSLTLGARYSHDKKEFREGEIRTLVTGTSTVVGDQTFPDQDHAWGAFTPKVTLSYKLPDVLAYVTYSQGYKSGQYEVASPSAPGPVNPEKLTDIEAGLKATLFENRLKLNVSAFHYDYKDLQVFVVRIINNTLTTELVNAAKAKIYGGDVSATALLFNGFTVGAVVAFNQSSYASFPSYSASIRGPVGNVAQDIVATGNPVQRDPKWTSSLTADYQTTFANAGTLSESILWSHNSGFSWDPSNLYRQKAYDILNASVGYTVPNTNVRVSLWGTNLTNSEYEKIDFAYQFGQLGIDAPPRMYGMSISYKH